MSHEKPTFHLNHPSIRHDVRQPFVHGNNAAVFPPLYAPSPSYTPSIPPLAQTNDPTYEQLSSLRPSLRETMNYDKQLFQALDKKDSQKIFSLLKNPPAEWNINTAEKSNAPSTSLLIEACKAGLLDVVKAFVETHRASFSSFRKIKNGLHFAAENGDDEIVEYLLQSDKKLIDTENSTGWRALHFAVKAGHFNIVKRLVENGADLSKKVKLDGANYTVLALAEKYKHKKIKDYLEEKIKETPNVSLEVVTTTTPTATSSTTTTTTTTTNTAIPPNTTLAQTDIAIPQASPQIPFLFLKNKSSQAEENDKNSSKEINFLGGNRSSRKRPWDESVENKDLSDTEIEEKSEVDEPPLKKQKQR